MTAIDVDYKEKEESGKHPREKSPEEQEQDEIDAERAELRSTITDRLARLSRPLSSFVKGFITLTQSGRLKRSSEKPEGYEHKEVVQLSLESLVDGIDAIGALAEAIARDDDTVDAAPYKTVSAIIKHTIRTIYDHKCFAGICPTDQVMVEEGMAAINVLILNDEGLRIQPCHELFAIPDELIPQLDKTVSMWGHFLGKQYDITPYLDREIFEQLEQLKERAKPLNRLFGGLIRGLDDAIDIARAEHRQEQEEEELEPIAPPLDPPVQHTHGIPHPHFPPRMEDAYAELTGSEKLLLERDGQFDDLVQELLQQLLNKIQRPKKASNSNHQITDRFPRPSSTKESRLDEAYENIVPLSTLHLMNPRTFILALINQWAVLHPASIKRSPDAFREKTVREIIAEVNPGSLLLSIIAKRRREISQHEGAGSPEDLLKKYGKFAELATTALFPRTKNIGRVAAGEVLCREALVAPEQKFSFSERITSSPLLDGAPPTTTDKICRLVIAVLDTLVNDPKRVGRSNPRPGGMDGFFFLLTGHHHEGARWLKTEPTDQPPMQERAQWLQGVFEQYLEGDPEIQTLMRAIFGLLQTKTKDEWRGKGVNKRSLFTLVSKRAEQVPQDLEAMEAFKAAYDAPYAKLEMTVGELLDEADIDLHLSDLARALHAYWHKSLHAIMPIVFGLLRTDPRLRGRFTRSFTIEDIGIENLPRFFQGWQEKTGQLALPHIRHDGRVDVYVISCSGSRKNLDDSKEQQ